MPSHRPVGAPWRGDLTHRREDDAGRAVERRTPRALAITTPSADDVVAAAPWCSNTVATVVRGVGGEGVLPAELVEGGVEVGARRRRGGVLDALGEELALLGVHHRSGPRSRSRRATMLRWISALPP